MSIHRMVSVLLIGIMLIVGHDLRAGDRGKEMYAISEQLLGLVKDVFAGRSIDKTKVLIKTDGFLIDGGEFYLLVEAIYGKDAHGVLTSEQKRSIATSQFSMPDNQSSAYLVVRTEDANKSEPHMHSIFFSKTDNGAWQLDHWHTSH